MSLINQSEKRYKMYKQLIIPFFEQLKKVKKIMLLVLFSCLCLMSCLDKIDVPLRQETKQMVVEGLLTNDPKFQLLRISQTTTFGNANSIEPLKGAYVEIRSSLSETVVMRASPNEIGLYKPEDPNWVGKAGVAYSIFIKLPDGRTFQSAPQKMPQAVAIENIDANFVEGGSPGFETSVSFKDPSDTENFYRWNATGFHIRKSKGVPTGFGNSVCCDRCWVLKEERAVNIFSDALVNGNLVKNRPVYLSPFYVIGKHLIEIQQFTISRETYQFWNRYKDQQQRTGSIFDPLPAALTGNVVNITDSQDIALGYFEVSAIARKRIEPSATTQGALAISFDNSLYVPAGDCLSAFPFSVYATENPSGW
jgi:hypothetical protein